MIIQAFAKAYGSVDLILGATTPTTAFGIGEKSGDPLAMYQSDICTIPTNLAGHPALSVPFGKGVDQMPIGVQLLGPTLSEQRLFQAARVIEQGAPA